MTLPFASKGTIAHTPHSGTISRISLTRNAVSCEIILHRSNDSADKLTKIIGIYLT
jgi:hypothetical protein